MGKHPLTVDGWQHIIRGDGRIEVQCNHGVGHTSERLSKAKNVLTHAFNGIHGCDGCCDRDEFREMEVLGFMRLLTSDHEPDRENVSAYLASVAFENPDPVGWLKRRLGFND